MHKSFLDQSARRGESRPPIRNACFLSSWVRVFISFVRDISLRFPSTIITTTGAHQPRRISPRASHDMLRSATVLALVGTAAAAGTYPTKAESCSALGSRLTCSMLEDKDACNANTDCLWEENEEYPDESSCGAGEAISMQMQYAMMNA